MATWRRRTEDDQGQGGEVRRPPVHRHQGQGAARLGAVEDVRRGQVRGRPCVRRLVDRRLEGHPGLRHAADAGPGHRGARPVRRRDDDEHHLRRDRAVGRQGLRARPALAREARRGLPQVLGHRRRRLLRSGARVLHLRRGRVVGRHVGQLLQGVLVRGRVVDRGEVRGRQHGPSPDGEGRLLPRPAGRLAAGHPLGDVPRARVDGRRGRGAPPRGRERGPVRDRHEVRVAGEARRLGARS